MDDVLGEALQEFYYTHPKAKLWIHNKYGEKEDMPVRTYFREEQEMPALELTAIAACSGTVLDVGAGAGSHALLLQQKGFDVTAMDISPKAVELMKQRGVKHTICSDIFNYTNKQFDTVVLLMNGIGLTGNIEHLHTFLQHAKKLLKTGGQLLFDSSDIAYLYEGKLPTGKYYGEIEYEYRYKGLRSGWFSWLYVDKTTLTAIAAKEGWNTEVLFEDEFGQYLVRMTLVN